MSLPEALVRCAELVCGAIQQIAIGIAVCGFVFGMTVMAHGRWWKKENGP